VLTISEKDVLKSLSRDNPWWTGVDPKAGIPLYSRHRAYFGGFTKLALNWNIRRSVVLMGPRRVGKTVMLHQLILEALNQGIKPQDIFFTSIDTPVYSGIPLQKLLDIFEENSGCTPNGRHLVIFDEIQYLKDWEVHLKVLTDRYPNTRFIASGSAAAALRRKSNESGAGRFTDYILPPLTFSEYLDFSDIENIMIDIGEDGNYVVKDINALNTAFLDYITIGGYPEAVLSPALREDPGRFLGRDVIDKVLLRDLPSLYGIQDIQELNRLFTTLAYHTGAEISLEKLSQSSGVAKNTISRYLEYLEAAFLIIRITRIDETGHSFQRVRNFKTYLANPSMRAALFGPVSADDPVVGALVETAIVSQYLHLPTIPQLHFARWKSGRTDLEIDLVWLDSLSRPMQALEIKWTNRPTERPEEELKGLIAFGIHHAAGIKLVATTRSVEGVWSGSGARIDFIPSAFLCYMVGKVFAGKYHPHQTSS
jgi:uncharacterized protein